MTPRRACGWAARLACALPVLAGEPESGSRTERQAGMTTESIAAPRDVAFTAQYDGSRQKYVEILPRGFDPGTRQHLLVFLHGHGSDRWQITRGDTWKEIQAVYDFAVQKGLILLSPDYRASTSWMGPAAEADVVQIIREQQSTRRIGKVLLAGASMGGAAVLIFAALHPDLVNGVCSMNGVASMVVFTGFPEAVAEAYGGRKDEKPEEYRKRSPALCPERFRGIPMAFTVGGRDTSCPPHSVLRLAAALRDHDPGNVLLIHREQDGHSTRYEDAMRALAFVWTNAVAGGQTAAPH